MKYDLDLFFIFYFNMRKNYVVYISQTKGRGEGVWTLDNDVHLELVLDAGVPEGHEETSVPAQSTLYNV